MDRWWDKCATSGVEGKLFYSRVMRGLLVGLALACGLLDETGLQRDAGDAAAVRVEGAVAGAHDPSMARDGGTYYVFATGHAPGAPPGSAELPVRCSEDLRVWRMCGSVFDAVPEWIKQASPGTRDLWAPDVSFTHGEYRLYYAYSLFGKRTSGIALATNKTLDAKAAGYGWVDKGLVIASTNADDFNAIDPAYVEDDKGGGWLAFGSFWSGIKMRAVDARTGLLSTTDTKLYSLARREGGAEGSAVEAPYVVAHGGYYYLFVSFGICCKGAKSTYRIMVGRAKKVTGPYEDEAGRKMMDGGGTEVLVGNSAWAGPGGESVMRDKDGTDLLVFHAYDAVTGRSQLQISRIGWVDGWPRAVLSTEKTSAP